MYVLYVYICTYSTYLQYVQYICTYNMEYGAGVDLVEYSWDQKVQVGIFQMWKHTVVYKFYIVGYRLSSDF